MKKFHVLMLGTALLFGGCKATAQSASIDTTTSSANINTEGSLELLQLPALSMIAATSTYLLTYLGKEINKMDTNSDNGGNGKSWSPGDCLLTAAKITGRFTYICMLLSLFPITPFLAL